MQRVTLPASLITQSPADMELSGPRYGAFVVERFHGVELAVHTVTFRAYLLDDVPAVKQQYHASKQVVVTLAPELVKLDDVPIVKEPVIAASEPLESETPETPAVTPANPQHAGNKRRR